MTDRWQLPLQEISRAPMTGHLLDEARRGPRFPEPGPRTSTRLVAVAVAVAVAIAAAAVIRPMLNTGQALTHRNDTVGWTVTVPSDWQQIHPVASPGDRFGLDRTFELNTFFANEQASVIDDEPVSTIDQLLSVPDGGVLVMIWPSNLSTVVNSMVEDDDQYPPAPALAAAQGAQDAQDHDSATFRADGIQFLVDAFYGADVSDEDRAAANTIATSIAVPPAPAPPSEGFATMRFPDHPDLPIWRLGPAERFAPGTVVEVKVEPTPGVEQPKSLFIVTPTEPANSAEHWMVSGADARCHDHPLTWNGKVFRCDGRSFDPEGTPTRHVGPGLTTSSVVETWEGQLITPFDGAVSVPPGTFTATG